MNVSVHYRFLLPCITSILFLSTGAVAAPGVQVKLTGQNDVNIDRPAIQAAIDSAPGKRLTIKLSGTFQLDGQDLLIDRSNIEIKGDRRGATLLGKLGPGGTPIDDIDNFPNRGFLIESANPLSNIEIKDLNFSGLRSPVFPRGQMNEISDVQIKNNLVENSIFGVSAVGALSDILIANNTVHDVSSSGIIVFGTPEGLPDGVRIVDNQISDAGGNGLFIGDISNAVIANNFLATSDANPDVTPIFAEGMNSNVLLEGNTTHGGVIGVLLTGEASDFLVTRNCIREGGTQGLPFFRGGGIQVGIFGLQGSGFDIADNSYSGNLAGDPGVPRDVWLTIDSSDSTANERAAAVVVDEGASNSVGILPEDGVNHCD